jgi:hypothetical protein
MRISAWWIFGLLLVAAPLVASADMADSTGRVPCPCRLDKHRRGPAAAPTQDPGAIPQTLSFSPQSAPAAAARQPAEEPPIPPPAETVLEFKSAPPKEQPPQTPPKPQQPEVQPHAPVTLPPVVAPPPLM